MFWPSYPALHGFDGMPMRIFRALRKAGSAAKREFGRSYFAQMSDMARAWWANDLSPADYHLGLLARHCGRPEICDYVSFSVLNEIWIELQIDTFGAEPVRREDKAVFGAWRRANGFPGPREFALDPTSPAPSSNDITSLGNRLIAKPRGSQGGRGVEAWMRDDAGRWRCGERSIATDELARWLAHRADEESGLVVQERLRNHGDIAELCGEALSTCRIVTLLNEQDEPEVVEFFWRIAARPDSVVDNYHAGGVCWMVSDFNLGTIDYGIGPETPSTQKALRTHPITGKNMVGFRHPLWTQARDLALAGHRKLPDLVAIGWDIATTPTGPAMIEINLPAGAEANHFITSNGIEETRYGNILAWRARRWLEQHLPANSRRRVGLEFAPV